MGIRVVALVFIGIPIFQLCSESLAALTDHNRYQAMVAAGVAPSGRMPWSGPHLLQALPHIVTGVALLLAQRRLLNWLMPLPGPACPHCGYDTRGLKQNKCPECGGQITNP